jgi:ADP-heptose:LPS heptosyltransferase
VIDLGQLGDVVLSLPALKAICDAFPHSAISVIVAKSNAEIVRLSGLPFEVIKVDRVGLRRGNKLGSSVKILKFALNIRRRKFDLVIDLHSLPETNLLGFVSGAKSRLFANRESRSIDMLSNFRPKPPREDKTLHITDYYLGTLRPLGIEANGANIRLQPRLGDLQHVREIFRQNGVVDQAVVGIAPGAGHPSRRWPLERFARLAVRLGQELGMSTVFFVGPEEESDIEQRIEHLAPGSVAIRGLSMGQLIAGLSMMSAIVSNDSGPAHVAAAAGTPIVIVQNSDSPRRFLPRAEKLVTVCSDEITDINEDQVFDEVRSLLTTSHPSGRFTTST